MLYCPHYFSVFLSVDSWIAPGLLPQRHDLARRVDLQPQPPLPNHRGAHVDRRGVEPLPDDRNPLSQSASNRRLRFNGSRKIAVLRSSLTQSESIAPCEMHSNSAREHSSPRSIIE